MHKGRLEAFSDGVMAIIITIMVLEFKIPHSADWSALANMYPVFISYLISFVYVAIYWNNHHHMFQATKTVNGRVLWANMVLLFCLSLFPFVSGWMGENHFASLPVSAFGFVLLLCALSYTLLHKELMKIHEKDSVLHKANKHIRTKIVISNICYVLAVIVPFFHNVIGFIFTIIPAVIWLIPDSEIEKELAKH